MQKLFPTVLFLTWHMFILWAKGIKWVLLHWFQISSADSTWARALAQWLLPTWLSSLLINLNPSESCNYHFDGLFSTNWKITTWQLPLILLAAESCFTFRLYFWFQIFQSQEQFVFSGINQVQKKIKTKKILVYPSENKEANWLLLQKLQNIMW